jgi:two-component system OmpR family response regulator
MTPICKILIVEDEGAIADLLSEVFAENGYMVATAATTDEMRAELDAGRFDIVVLDLMLPGRESGWSLVEHVRTRDIGLVVVTGDMRQLPRLEASGIPYLAKPFRLEQFLRLVEEILRQRQAKCARRIRYEA